MGIIFQPNAGSTSADGTVYLKGDEKTDGSWRAVIDTAGAMSFQYRQSGAWASKGFLPRSGGSFKAIVRVGDDINGMLDNERLRESLAISDEGAMDGRSPVLGVVNDYLAWQYPGDASWTNLIAIADLMPEPVKGDNGVTPVLRAAGNELQASYDAGQTWSNVFNLQALRPADGKDGEDGSTPQLRTTSGMLQGSYDGVTWFDMFDLASLKATDGRNALMRVSEGQVQWQLQGDGQWQTLFAVPANGKDAPPNVLDVGSVETLPPGSVATFSITGASPKQVVNVGIPAGRPGESIKGDAGPPNILKIGTVTSGPAAASITGASPSQTLNFTLPAGRDGVDGKSVELQKTATHIQWRKAGETAWQNLAALTELAGAPGNNGISYTPQSPVARTVSIGTAYQHTDVTKPYKVVVNARATSQVTLLALNQIDRVELRIGPTAASVALNGSGGFSMGVWETGIAGISVTVGTSLQDGGQISADVPVGWYFSVNRQQGNAATIVSCFTQSLAP